MTEMTETENDKTARQAGFADFQELLQLVGTVVVKTDKQLHDFLNWKIYSGTKEGLMQLERE